MGTADAVYDRSIRAIRERLDRAIQHGVHKLGIRTCPDGPVDHEAIKAVVHGRQIHLARRQLELRNIGEPFVLGAAA